MVDLGTIIVVVVGLLVLLFLVLVYLRSPAVVIKSALRKARKVGVSSAPDGEPVKVVGKLRMDESNERLESPIMGQSCAYFEVRVEERVSVRGSLTWETIVETKRSVGSIVLEDETGRAFVHLDAPKVDVSFDTRFNSGSSNQPTARLERFLADHGKQRKGLLSTTKLRFSEGVLKEGDSVAVLGRSSWEPDPSPSAQRAGYRDVPLRLNISAPAEEKVILSDDPSTF